MGYNEHLKAALDQWVTVLVVGVYKFIFDTILKCIYYNVSNFSLCVLCIIA